MEGEAAAAGAGDERAPRRARWPHEPTTRRVPRPVAEIFSYSAAQSHRGATVKEN